MKQPQNKPETFAGLGIPFPLFEAPVEEASEYCGEARCAACHREAAHCFALGIGCALMTPCGQCGAINGLDADDRTDEPCRVCSAMVPFPAADKGMLAVCYTCLRAGKAAIAKDTILGMVTWNEAAAGITHGAPGLEHPDFEIVPGADDWNAAKVPPDLLWDLVRTPSYLSIQGELWEFCCKRPMVYVGAWSREEFNARAPDGDGEAYFNRIVGDPWPGPWEVEIPEETGIYLFRCSVCSREIANWDVE